MNDLLESRWKVKHMKNSGKLPVVRQSVPGMAIKLMNGRYLHMSPFQLLTFAVTRAAR